MANNKNAEGERFILKQSKPLLSADSLNEFLRGYFKRENEVWFV